MFRWPSPAHLVLLTTACAPVTSQRRVSQYTHQVLSTPGRPAYPYRIVTRTVVSPCFFNKIFVCLPLVAGVAHRLHNKHGKNVVVLGDGCQAVRVGGYSHGIVFSAKELKTDELFEVRSGPSYRSVPYCPVPVTALLSPAPGEDQRGGRAMVRLASHRPDHPAASGSALLPPQRPVALPHTAQVKGHLAARRVRGQTQRRAAETKLRLLARPTDGERTSCRGWTVMKHFVCLFVLHLK